MPAVGVNEQAWSLGYTPLGPIGDTMHVPLTVQPPTRSVNDAMRWAVSTATCLLPFARLLFLSLLFADIGNHRAVPLARVRVLV